MTEQETYMHGNSYEFFIRRAFNCERGKHGAETAYFKFLLMADIGKNFLSKPYEKQFKDVKGYIIKAIDKFLQRKPTSDEQIFLASMRARVESAENATDLVNPIIEGLHATQRYRDL
ncbi:hypothetical protein [Aquiflexum gelatinilyticum]|uniref:Uncharacterized protein n=1 Tax=Aquiflexum gelatinilyticum TaxID=2961943 RepID=A0A9X2T2C7_9BACT|nr:hypothetical protein [Aquiflexum gelatinilyticum]MCR9015335.1 hypothetical protein [Aquiflexum gelatinilyticum]